MRNSAHYDEPVPRRRRPMTDRMLALAALILAAVSIVVSLLT